MLFGSLEFAIFLPIVFVLYWFVTNKNLRHQNILLLLASYFFYGWWDWRFLSLIVFSTCIDYLIGIYLGIDLDNRKRKFLLLSSIAMNIGFLGLFKYYNFFAESFAQAFSLFGASFEPYRLNIILPVGISFYTFQTLSYSIDVYRKKLKPTKDFIAFAAFVSFFPQLVAGPIERAANLLPQFHKPRVFSYDEASDGLKQILWGLFKKIVIADNCAVYANAIFDNSDNYSGSSLLIGAIFFTFQIYGDFSGYSDIAIGTAKLFRFKLMQNFAFPYFSRDFGEFWRRWHISLSTWFRDYLYIPLGGSRGSKLLSIRNVFIIFIVSGFWHGASWNFIAWGALNAAYFLPLLLLKKNRKNLNTIAENSFFPSLKELIGMLTTFSLTVIAWIFFRAESLFEALNFISNIFCKALFSFPMVEVLGQSKLQMGVVIVLIIFLIIVEWIFRKERFAFDNISKVKPFFRWSIYLGVSILIFIFRASEKQDFIYFQF